MLLTSTQWTWFFAGTLLLWVISKADKAGIHLFEEFKLATLSTDGEFLKFFTITCFVLNRISLVESALVKLFLALTSSCSMMCQPFTTITILQYFKCSSPPWLVFS